jgi:hypothetical protein
MAERVFLSYSSVDRVDALSVRRILEDSGCDVWMDVFDIKVGAALRDELKAQLDRADTVCVLLSPHSVASSWVTLEIEQTLAGSPARDRFLGVVLRPFDAPPELADRICLDASAGLDAESFRVRLLRAVRGERGGELARLDAALTREPSERAAQIEAARMSVSGIVLSPLRHGKAPHRSRDLVGRSARDVDP